MTDPAGFAIMAFIVVIALWHLGVWRWAWRRYVSQPGTSLWRRAKSRVWWRWKPREKRPPMPQSLRQHIFARDGYRCRIPNRYGRACGNAAGWGMKLEPHHWLPVKHFNGLFYDTRHLVTACMPCNRRLGAKIPKWAYDWNDEESIRTGKRPPKIGRARAWRGVVTQPDRRIVPNAA